MPAKRAATRRKWIDPDDGAELTDAELARAVHTIGDKVIRRGRPRLKDQITLRIDHDVVERFRAGGAGWQSRINDVLRRYVARAGRARGKS